jgi:RNA polymerase sigma-70 factor (ECF subfamily)
MQQVRAGSQEAAWELIERYGPHIQRAVRRRLHASLRSKFDSIDFVQSVWASFFTSRNQAVQFDTPESLIAFLAALARNKVVDEFRRRVQTEKHDITRERALHEDIDVSPESVPGPEATPSQVAVARERWNRLVDQQPEHYRQIIQLRFEGKTQEEIAREIGVNERTVRKILERLNLE